MSFTFGGRGALLLELFAGAFLSACSHQALLLSDTPPAGEISAANDTAKLPPVADRKPARNAGLTCSEALSRILRDKDREITNMRLGPTERFAKPILTATAVAGSVAGVKVYAELAIAPTEAVTADWDQWPPYADLIAKGMSKNEIIENKIPHIAMIGDSLATSFYLSTSVDTIWRMWTDNGPNLFLDPSPNEKSIHSFFERISEHHPVFAKNYARPAATIYRGRSSYGPMMNYLGNIQPLDEQIANISAENRFPDLTLVWIGHNNMDWAGGYNPDEIDTPDEQEIVLREIREQVRSNMEFQMLKLINDGMKSGHRFAVVVYGIGNFESYFKARETAEIEHQYDSQRYPFIDESEKHLVSLNPKYRKQLLELAHNCNDDTRATLEKLKTAYAKFSSRAYLQYADDLANAEYKVEYLHPMDGWHLNARGQSEMAQLLYQGAIPALEFIKVLTK